MNVSLLGLGLIGGSVARCLARRRDAGERLVLSAWTPSGDGPAQARAEGVIDTAAERASDVIVGADLLILAGPPQDVLATVVELGDASSVLGSALAASTTVTDVASTKGLIVAAADAAGLRFVGGHPMAGRETSGWRAARNDLFADRPWVIVPGRAAQQDDVERVRWLAEVCGADPIELSAEAHDAAAAAISHLPLVVAAALVEAVMGIDPGADLDDGRGLALAERLAASGWRDTTRLARGDPRMAAGIAATNAALLDARLRDLQAVLDGWRAALATSSAGRPKAEDVAALERRFDLARERLEGIGTP